MIRIGICDNEEIIRKEIIYILKNEKIDCIIHEYSSGEEMLLDNSIIDIVLLDINLSGMDGFEVARILRKRYEELYIIFFASHNQFVEKAFYVKAYRFLQKPINKLKLIQSIKDAEAELIRKQVIIIEEKGTKSILKIKDIVYLEAFGDGVYIFTKDDVYISSKSLKYYMNKLGTEHFYKTHRAYIVSLGKIISIEETGIVLTGIKERIPISRRNRKKVKEELDQYLIKYAICIG